MNAEAHYQLALASLAVGNGRAAAEELAKVIQLKPDHWAAHVRLAELMATSSAPDVLHDAQTMLTGVLTHVPRDPGAVAALSIVEWKLGRRNDALQRLERSLAMLPPSPGSSVILAKMKMALGDRAGAENLLRASADASVGATTALAEFYTATNRYAEAETTLKRALVRDPHNPAALLDLAALQTAGNRPGDAAVTYRTLAELPDPRYRPLYGLFLIGAGKPGLAVQEFERLSKRYPSDGALRTGLVTAYLAAGRTADAGRVLQSAVQQPDPDYDALYQNAVFTLGQGRVEDAQASILAALRLRPEEAEAHYVLAAVHLRRARVLSSVEQLGQALERDPRFLQARIELARYRIASKAPDVALDLLSQTPGRARTSPAVAAERLWALLAMDERQRFSTELAAARRRGGSSTLEIEAALAALEREPAEARHIAEEALRSNPADMRALLLVARSYFVESGPRAATESVERYAAGHTGLPEAARLLGELLLAQNRIPAAIAAFDKAVAAGSRTPALETAAARAELRAGETDPAEARLARVVAADPTNYGARLLLGVAQQMKGSYSEAADSYRKTLDINPSNVPALYNLAYVLAEHLGNPEEALHLAEKAKELAPESAAVDDVFGWVLHRRGIDSLAAIHLADALRGGYSRAAAHLAAVRSGTGGPAPAPDPIAHGWTDLGASNTLPARLEAYQRTRGCEPDPAALDAVLTERDARRFTARMILPLMLCEPRPQPAAASGATLQTRFEKAAEQWTDPDVMLQSLFNLSGVELPDVPGWDNTYVAWDSDRKGVPRKMKAPTFRVADHYSLRPPLDPPDGAGWNVYDSIWPRSFR